MFHKIESEMDSAIELAWIDSPDAVDMDSCKARNAVFLKTMQRDKNWLRCLNFELSIFGSGMSWAE